MATTKKATTPRKKTTPAKKGKAAKAAGSSKLHYDKTALLNEYSNTYGMMMKATAFVIGIAVLYFFFMLVFVGETSTTHGDFYEQFGDRIDIPYEGLKLPMYEE